jgi:hypothetical protein
VELLLAVMGTLAFISCVLVLASLKMVRAVTRRVREVQGRAGLAIRARSGGDYGEVAQLRRDVDRALTAARRALAAARAVNAPIGDVPSLLARLSLAAGQVDGELRLLEAQPDVARLQRQLPGPRSRAQAVTSAAADLVDGLSAAAGHGAADLSLLQAECSIEADALRAAAARQDAQQRRGRPA